MKVWISKQLTIVIAIVSEAIHREARQVWMLRRKRSFARNASRLSQAMTLKHDSSISPHDFARGMTISFGPLKAEGAGKTGRTMHPQPRVQK